MALTKNSTYKLNSGYEIPVIGLGVYLAEKDVTRDVVYQALKDGYRHIDSAQLYKNEKEVGEGIVKWLKEDPSHKREDVFYTTKVGTDFQGYEKALASLEESFEKVKELKYIDLVLVHSPKTDKERRLGTYKALQEYVDKGIIRSIGVSNYGIRHIEELLSWPGLKYKPAIDQVEFNPWLLRQELTDYLKKNDIVAEAYSPLTRGYRLDHPDLLKVAANLNKTPAQVLIRWSLQRGYVTLPKTVNLTRLKQNLEVFDFEIDDENYNILTNDENWISSKRAPDDPIYYEDP